ncbi:type II toxin-antitoxin system PemK/MazF family toxin [Kocuria flava]|uniref:type II toxin-antitoxin system PemK/MazF family toxin n=1 Tax=Kocuria flava TaxID=446860 RepID=UPI003F1DFE98
MKLNLRTLGRLAVRALDVYRSARRAPGPAPGRTAPRRGPGRRGGRAPEGLSRPYPGDWTGPVRPVYRPLSDGQADPGEVVWTWVPFEEDPSRGKDRPVLVVDRAGEHLLCLMLTSRDRTDHLRQDPDYVDVGTGAWDPRGRPSEVKLDRVVQVLPADVRREGAVLPEDRFDRVAAALHRRRT